MLPTVNNLLFVFIVLFSTVNFNTFGHASGTKRRKINFGACCGIKYEVGAWQSDCKDRGFESYPPYLANELSM